MSTNVCRAIEPTTCEWAYLSVARNGQTYNDPRALVDVFGKLIMSPSILFWVVVFYEFVRRLAVTSTPFLLLMIIYKYTKHDSYLQKQTIDLYKIIKKAKL